MGIDVKKVRLWSVNFAQAVIAEEFPYPVSIVEERETAGYLETGKTDKRNFAVLVRA